MLYKNLVMQARSICIVPFPAAVQAAFTLNSAFVEFVLCPTVAGEKVSIVRRLEFLFFFISDAKRQRDSDVD